MKFETILIVLIMVVLGGISRLGLELMSIEVLDSTSMVNIVGVGMLMFCLFIFILDINDKLRFIESEGLYVIVSVILIQLYFIIICIIGYQIYIRPMENILGGLINIVADSIMMFIVCYSPECKEEAEYIYSSYNSST